MAEDEDLSDEIDLSEEADFSGLEPPRVGNPHAPIKVVVDDLHIIYRVWTLSPVERVVVAEDQFFAFRRSLLVDGIRI